MACMVVGNESIAVTRCLGVNSLLSVEGAASVQTGSPHPEEARSAVSIARGNPRAVRGQQRWCSCRLSAEITPRDETRSCGPLLRVRLIVQLEWTLP